MIPPMHSGEVEFLYTYAEMSDYLQTTASVRASLHEKALDRHTG